jgi:hypothetical protein
MCLTDFSTSLSFSTSDIVLPNKGMALRRIAIASNTPSTRTIGCFQSTCSSNPTTFLDIDGFLYFNVSSL